MSESIRVPFSCITGSRVKTGSNLKNCICGILDDGNSVIVETPDGERNFTSNADFLEWYEWSDPDNYVP